MSIKQELIEKIQNKIFGEITLAFTVVIFINS